MAIRIAVAGAAGRMGRLIVALASADARFSLAAALEAPGSGALNRDAGELAGTGRLGVPLTDACAADFDVLIDFSSPAGTVAWLRLCEQRGRPIVIGTTGHDAAQSAAIEAAAGRIAVLKAANMSTGVNVMLRAVEQVAAALGADYDVEIIETHHRFKVDAPSGTALALKDAILRGRGAAAADIVHGRQGATGPRPAGQIGIHALRAGDVVGEHEVRFTTPGETLAVRHVAHSRDTFARGALTAAAWIVGRPPGRYDMTNVLFPARDGGGRQRR